MALAGPLSTFRLPEPVKRRIEVATATATEALLETHARYGVRLVRLLRDQLPFDEAVDRYIDEMGLGGDAARAARSRIFVALEEAERHGQGPDFDGEPGARTGRSGLRRLRRLRPDVVVRDMKQRQRRHEETDRIIQLGLAQAEEGLLDTHIENALDFAALLDDHFSFERAIEQYLAEIGLSGCRAQAVVQRAMCRIADAQIGSVKREKGEARRAKGEESAPEV